MSKFRYRLPLFASTVGLPTGAKLTQNGWFYPKDDLEEAALIALGALADDTRDNDTQAIGLNGEQAAAAINRGALVMGGTGDSLMAQNHATSASGDYAQVQGAQVWACAALHQSIVFPLELNKAIGGQTSSQVVARLSTDFDGLDLGVLAVSMGINDIAAGVSADKVMDNYETLRKYARRRGWILALQTPHPPSQPFSSNDAAYHQQLLRLRNLMLRWAEGFGDVIVTDAYGLLLDSTTNPPRSFGAWSLDDGGSGFHYNSTGAVLIGMDQASKLKAFCRYRDGLVCSAADNTVVSTTSDNIFEFGLMTGNTGTLAGAGAEGVPMGNWTSGQVVVAGDARINAGNLYYTRTGGTCGATAPTHVGAVKYDEFGRPFFDPVTASDGGVVWEFQGTGAVAGMADGQTFDRTAGTGVASVCTVNRADGKGKDVVFAITGAGNNTTWQNGYTTPVSSRANPGKTYVAEEECTVLGAVNFYAPTMRLLTNVLGSAKQQRSLSASTTIVGNIPRDITFRHRTQPFTVAGAAQQSDVTSFSVQEFFTFTGNNGRAFIKVGRKSLRNVY